MAHSVAQDVAHTRTVCYCVLLVMCAFACVLLRNADRFPTVLQALYGLHARESVVIAFVDNAVDLVEKQLNGFFSHEAHTLFSFHPQPPCLIMISRSLSRSLRSGRYPAPHLSFA